MLNSEKKHTFQLWIQITGRGREACLGAEQGLLVLTSLASVTLPEHLHRLQTEQNDDKI